MAIRSKDEIMDALRGIVGDSTDDSTLSFVEDVSDTLSDYADREAEDWKSKYEQNDAEWREKYRNRFFGDVPEGEVREAERHEEALPKTEEGEEVEVIETYEELFDEVTE